MSLFMLSCFWHRIVLIKYPKIIYFASNRAGPHHVGAGGQLQGGDQDGGHGVDWGTPNWNMSFNVTFAPTY